jgi:hypothetical protein
MVRVGEEPVRSVVQADSAAGPPHGEHECVTSARKFRRRVNLGGISTV